MPIHWWQTHELVDDLAHGRVTEQQSVWYAMFSAVIGTEVLYYAYWFGGERGWLLFLEFGAVCVISIIGLHECFKANGGATGSHFLKRLFCLGVPVGIKLAIASALVGQLMYFGFPRLAMAGVFSRTHFFFRLASFFIAGTFTVIYYWRIVYHMSSIAMTE